MQSIRGAFPLDSVSENFPQNVDQRIDNVILQSCPSRWHVGYAQFWYSGNQYKEKFDTDLEMVANSLGMTALMLASLEGDIGAARILLRRGASVGLVNCYGRTALILAAMAGREEIVKLLLSVDAPVDVTDTFGRDALTWADERRHKKIAILVRKAAHDRRDWRMAQLREREAQRAAHAARGSSSADAPPAGYDEAAALARYEAAAGVSARPYHETSTSAKGSARSARSKNAYTMPTSSRENAQSVNRAPYRKIGPIGFGVLSARGGPGAKKHGITPGSKWTPTAPGSSSSSAAQPTPNGSSVAPRGAAPAPPKRSGILSVRSGGTATGRRGFLSRRSRDKDTPAGGAETSAAGGGNWFSRAMGSMSRRAPSPSAETEASAAAPGKQTMYDEAALPGDEGPSTKWAADVGDYGSARTAGAKSSVRGSARSWVSSARSAIYSTRSQPGFISGYGVGAHDKVSTNPNLDLFLATQQVKAAGAHGGAASDRGNWQPLGMEMLPEVMAMRRRHDREWEMGMRDKHEQRISPQEVAKHKSSRRRAWMNSSRRWIEKRKTLQEQMTPKERKLSRGRLYSTPRHYATNKPRVYA